MFINDKNKNNNRRVLSSTIDWYFCHPKICALKLISSSMIFGVGTLAADWVMRLEISLIPSVSLKKRTWRPSSHLPCEDVERRWFFMKEEVLLTRLNLLAPWSGIPKPPELWDLNACASSHPIYGISL